MEEAAPSPKNQESPMKAIRESLSQEESLTTNIEKLKALDAQRAQLLEDAKKEALHNAEKAVAELNELGFHYALTEGASVSASTPRASRKAGADPSKRQARDLPCPICHFKTMPHHDGRMHRSQKTKKPFTVEELMERHLAKVG
jgi:ribosomal protein L17